jgi:hypothetical protein
LSGGQGKQNSNEGDAPQRQAEAYRTFGRVACSAVLLALALLANFFSSNVAGLMVVTVVAYDVIRFWRNRAWNIENDTVGNTARSSAAPEERNIYRTREPIDDQAPAERNVPAIGPVRRALTIRSAGATGSLLKLGFYKHFIPTGLVARFHAKACQYSSTRAFIRTGSGKTAGRFTQSRHSS